MGEHRVDVLEDRVERLRERTERLQDEFVGVRTRVRALDGDTADHERRPGATNGRGVPEWLRAKRSEPADGERTVDPDASEASDREVEAAVRRVETDGDHDESGASDEEDAEEIIVA